MRIILASQSPRRRELFEKLGVPFEVMVSEEEEKITSSDPKEVTCQLSGQKAQAIAIQMEDGIVVGADTVVALEGKILGKPKDREDAINMIGSLQGKTHTVYTGVTILKKEKGKIVDKITFSEETKVFVDSMSDEEIFDYVETEEPYDKAGGYGIQGVFSKYIERIEGDYFNVVGLPIHRVYAVMKKWFD